MKCELPQDALLPSLLINIIMTIAVDFDGTIVKHKYPAIGEEIPFATETLKMLVEDQHRLILWTVREGELLQQAVDWCTERGVKFFAVNKDYPEETLENNNHFSRKLKVDMWIDDRNIGGLPDWGTIYKMITEHKTWDDLMMASSTNIDNYAVEDKPKKKWWQF